MSKLEKNLSLWVDNKLIDSAQKNNIIAFEDSKPKQNILLVIMLLGVFVIGIGIISLIASNWDFIPSWIKLSCNFMLLGSVVYGAYQSFVKQNTKAYEMFLFSLFLLCGATIGLVSQVFQLNGNHYIAMLFLSIITLPLTLLTRIGLLPVVWLPLFFIGTLSNFDIAGFISNLLNNFNIVFLNIIFVSFFIEAFYFSKQLYEKLNRKYKIIDVLSKYFFVIGYLIVIYSFNDTLYSYGSNLSNFILMFVLAMSFYSFMGYQFYKNNNIKSFKSQILLIAYSFFAIYVNVLGSLALTGMGLVIFGITILLSTYYINKFINKKVGDK